MPARKKAVSVQKAHLSNSEIIHKAYNESESSKQAMQATLYECLRRMDG